MDDVSQCRPAVQALVARVLRRRSDDPDVEDCTHDTLRRALEKMHQRHPDLPLLPWVLGIARHVALDALRAHYRTDRRWVSESADPSQNLAGQPDPGSGPELQAAHHQQAQRLERALADLPQGQRRAMLLFHVEQLGYKEIADELQVPVATVGTWILRARQRLLEVVGENEGRR